VQFVLSIRMAGLLTQSLQLQSQVTDVTLGGCAKSRVRKFLHSDGWRHHFLSAYVYIVVAIT
jgi:hypothetical protein